MKKSKAIEICLGYHQNYSKPNFIRAYETILTRFDLVFCEKDIGEISSEDILTFLGKITDGRKLHVKDGVTSRCDPILLSKEDGKMVEKLSEKDA